MVAPGVIYCHEWQGEPGVFYSLDFLGVEFPVAEKSPAPPKVWHLCNVGFTWPLLVVVDLRTLHCMMLLGFRTSDSIGFFAVKNTKRQLEVSIGKDAYEVGKFDLA